ncbi:hypothetical protein [Pseudomonas sp. S32]|uniref:hypothetical protein n=1 Tax=Pseudomonas sp. S32 TaxID=2767448 RepID=UPI0019134A1D|nr:hypothetical protein [Pseudomonas sp. S32]MBK5007320.1 hypothetical protein [Pseudomonas sp. S32]
MDQNPVRNDICLSISGIDLGDRVIELGHGIQLRTTFAHLFTTDILAFERPASPSSFHPGPWQAVSHKRGVDIQAELFIPREYSHPRLSSLVAGHTIISMLRLWVDPQISLQVLTQEPIAKLKDRAGKDKGGEPAAMLYAQRERHVNIGLINRDRIIESIDWVADNWSSALDLRSSSPEFKLALDTFDNAQSIPNTAMMLVSI